jgi:hypothetical protein
MADSASSFVRSAMASGLNQKSRRERLLNYATLRHLFLATQPITIHQTILSTNYNSGVKLESFSRFDSFDWNLMIGWLAFTNFTITQAIFMLSKSSGSVNLSEFVESTVASLSSGFTGVIATMVCLI